MGDYFSFLPEEDVFFVDSCALELIKPTNKTCFTGNRNRLEIQTLKAESCRARHLIKKLSNMENWITIQEVIDEFDEGIKSRTHLQKNLKNTALVSALGEVLDLSDKIYGLLIQEHRNTTNYLTEELSDKISNYLLPKVNKAFKERKGKTNEKNTDCKLIATALAYAEDMPIGMFSHDLALLKTFAYCAEKLDSNIKQTYVISEVMEETITTTEYHNLNKNIILSTY